MRGRQQSDLVPEFDQRPPSMMLRSDLALRADCVNLKHSLGQFQTNPRDSREIPARLPIAGSLQMG
jgi:hypothetical protein